MVAVDLMNSFCSFAAPIARVLCNYHFMYYNTAELYLAKSMNKLELYAETKSRRLIVLVYYNLLSFENTSNL